MKFSYFFIPTVLVLILPIVFILTGYTWTTSDLTQYPFLKYFTLSGGGIYGIIVSVVLTLVLMFYYRKNKTLAIAIACYCALAVGGLDLTKSLLKNYFQEPRPFVYQMAKTIYNANDPTYFRNLQLTYTNLNALAGLGLDNSTTTDSTTNTPTDQTTPATPATPDQNKANQNGTNNNDSTNSTNSADTNVANNTDQATNNDNSSSETPVTEQQAFSCKQCRNPEEISDFYYTLNTDQRQFFIKYFNSRFLADQPLKIQEELKSYAKIKHYSLPSGHALVGSIWIMIFFVLAFNIRLWSFWVITWGVTAWGIGLEASRILLGVHYPHDVLFGAVMASAGVWSTFWLTLVIYSFLYLILNKWLKVFPLHQVPANFVIATKKHKASDKVSTEESTNTNAETNK